VKKLSREQMRNAMGGLLLSEDGCKTTAPCPSGGDISCSGVSDCQKVVGVNISTVTCKNADATYSSQSCN